MRNINSNNDLHAINSRFVETTARNVDIMEHLPFSHVSSGAVVK